MRVLIVSQYFWPEYFRVNDLAIELQKNYEVDVLTGYPNYPDGNFYKEFLLNKKNFDKLENINIYRVPIIARKKGNKFQLILNYLSFLFSAIFFGSFLLRKKKYDYIITFATSPIIVALVSIFLAKLKNSKHIIWVLDLWPDVLNDLNIISKKSFLFKLFKLLVVYIYRKSDIILCQSLSFKKEILSQDEKLKKKLYFFPSWPEDLVNNNDSSKIINAKYDTNFTNVVFAGNIGESQNFDLVTKVFKNLNNDKIRLYVLGEGRDFKKLQDLKIRNNIDNLFLLGLKKFEEIQYYLLNADFLLISLQYKKTFDSTIPGKFQTYLKYKRPILGFVGGETNQIINKYKVGKAFNYIDDQSFIKEVENFFLLNKKIKINISSYDKLLNIYSKKRSIKKLINIFENLNKKYFYKLKLITDSSKINYNENFILSGLNLAFLGYFSSEKLLVHRSMMVWPDGFLKSRFFSKNVKKLPGRDFLKQLIINNKIIKKIIVMGKLESVSKKYLENHFQTEVTHIDLPMGNLDLFKKYIPIFNKDEICIITLPTPKQENLANFIADNQKHYKIFCFGGAVNMASGLEPPLPKYFSKVFFAETLWRLRFDTRRRLARLLETLFSYIKGEILKKYKKITFYEGV
jgi:glycosyltransferase involved in cell wall biosynthesis